MQSRAIFKTVAFTAYFMHSSMQYAICCDRNMTSYRERLRLFLPVGLWTGLYSLADARRRFGWLIVTFSFADVALVSACARVVSLRAERRRKIEINLINAMPDRQPAGQNASTLADCRGWRMWADSAIIHRAARWMISCCKKVSKINWREAMITACRMTTMDAAPRVIYICRLLGFRYSRPKRRIYLVAEPCAG